MIEYQKLVHHEHIYMQGKDIETESPNTKNNANFSLVIAPVCVATL